MVLFGTDVGGLAMQWRAAWAYCRNHACADQAWMAIMHEVYDRGPTGKWISNSGCQCRADAQNTDDRQQHSEAHSIASE